MDIFLIQCIVLIWTSWLTARRILASLPDRLLAAWIIAWANLVLTGLLTSLVHELGSSSWYLAASFGIGLTFIGATLSISQSVTTRSPQANRPFIHPGAWVLFGATIIPLGLAALVTAVTYQPNSIESLTWRLPRVMYYIGQNSLCHFDTSDLRQTFLPFNYDLVHVLGLVHAAPLQVLNLFNFTAWAVGGIATYRLCRLVDIPQNTSLAITWATLTVLPVFAQASVVSVDLPAGVALVTAVVFALQWSRHSQRTHAWIAAIAATLAGGSSLSVLVGLLLFFAINRLLMKRGITTLPALPRHVWLTATSVFVLPFALFNFLGDWAWPASLLQFVTTNEFPNTQSIEWSHFLMPSDGVAQNWREGSVLLNLPGALILIAALIGLVSARKRAPIVSQLALAGLGWLGLIGLSSFWLPLQSGTIVPAMLLLLPAAAMMLQASASLSQRNIRFLWCAFGLVGVLSTWVTVRHGLHNPDRPLLPVMTTDFPTPTLASLSPQLERQLSRSSHITVDSDGVDESIFPLLVTQPGQRITTGRAPHPTAFSLISRSTMARMSPYAATDTAVTYTMLAIESKKSAGVQLLDTQGAGAHMRDYFGIIANPELSRPSPLNRHVLVTVYKEAPPHDGTNQARVRLSGLHEQDGAWIKVSWQGTDGSINPLLIMKNSGEAALSIERPFDQLLFTAYDPVTQAKLGQAFITDQPRATKAFTPTTLTRPSGKRSVFITDLVLSDSIAPLQLTGLLPLEGPFPQWDLPELRWAREPRVKIVIPPMANVHRLQLSLSAKVHVRQQAALDVWFNGQLIQRYPMPDKLAWHDIALTLIPSKGENVIELRDGPMASLPDWMDYLERHPDVMAYVKSLDIPLEQGAREHYEAFGKNEHRMLQYKKVPEPAPDGYYFMFRSIRVEGLRQ